MRRVLLRSFFRKPEQPLFLYQLQTIIRRFLSPMALPNQNITMSALVIMLILHTSTTSKQKEKNMLSYNLSARYNDQHHMQISNFVKVINSRKIFIVYEHYHVNCDLG
uniref:Uncharacterized protein n=1 Tax=Strigamia maritima TaxID=126957 RepID=T1JMA5_STRMM